MKRRLLAAVACLALAVLACSCTPASLRDGPSIRLAVLGAFDQEVALLGKTLTDATSRRIEGIEFVSGRAGGRPVVIAWTGVGKVNAAMVTTLLIEHFKPTQVVFTGIAGAVDPNLEPGDIVIARQTAYHDMGSYWPEGIEPGGVKNRLTGDTNPVFFPADPNLLTVAQQAASKTTFDPIAHHNGQRPPKVVVGTIVTGDTFVSSKEKCAELAEKLDADAVEMEGAAVAQVCYQRGIGCVVIRSIADKADESAVVDKQKFYALAAKNSATLVAAILKGLEP
ncbi:MAG: 5'-methylthioadenosine/adenosylhomocysteine nucleosidase [Phycisphaerales bacterium]